MKRLTAIEENGNAFYPYCFREDTCFGAGESEKCTECDFAKKVCETLAAYENTGLTPEEVEKVRYLGTAVDLMKDVFGGKLRVNHVISGFVKFYRAQVGGRAADAVLLINEEVEEYLILKEKNKAAVPYVKVNEEEVKIGPIKFGKGTKVYRCPNCKRLIIYGDRYCRDCGHKLRWEGEHERNRENSGRGQQAD